MIQASGIEIAFNGQQILKGVDLQVSSGEVVVILGPSGSSGLGTRVGLSGSSGNNGFQLVPIVLKPVICMW